MNSLRSRLILGTLLGITLCLAANGALIFASVRSRRYSDLDRTLDAVVHAMLPFAMAEANRSERVWNRPPRTEGEGPGPASAFRDAGTYYHCWMADGTSLVKSEELGELDLAPIPTGPDGTFEPRIVGFGTVVLPDGRTGRSASLRVRIDRGRFGRPRRRDGQPGDRLLRGDRPLRGRRPEWGGAMDRGGMDRPAPLDETDSDALAAQETEDDRPPRGPLLADLVVARDTTELEADLEELQWMLVLGWLTSSLGCALILMWVVGRSLRPVEGLGRQLSSLDEGRLDHRFAVANTPLELTPIIDQLNGLMDRLGKAFEREQTLTAHAAHELRTPLTGLRSTLEVCLNRPRETEEYREAARDCLDITLMMQTMVERLLELGRKGELRIESAPLDELIDEAWDPYAERADERGMTLAKSFDRSLEIRTDLEGLSRILANLLENAIHYADAGTPIEVAAKTAADVDGLQIVVANAASQAPADVAEHAFDAFWRADSSRTETGVHAGLGLSLCKRIAETLGGRIDARLADGRFTMTLFLPQA